MGEHPERVLRRVVPEAAQVQVILGSLLGDARLLGRAGARRMRIAHRAERGEYVWWKYERLGWFAAGAPSPSGGLVAFHTIVHPLFDDLAPLFLGPGARGRVVRDLLAPLGLAVWLTDVGRLELRGELFLPAQRDRALAA